MIWLIGKAGMLGRELGGRLDAAGLPWVGSDREVDIRSGEALRAFAEGRDIGWIVNCAAYTAVDRAEDEPGIARELNVDGPRRIADLARELGARMIHISTDYVFDGSGTAPYLETDPVNPMGVYAATKAEGEAVVLENCGSSYILRTAWLYGKYGPNFVKTMLKVMAEKDEIRVVADQRGTPTYARDLAAAILELIASGKEAFGVYHYTNEGETTWHEFAVAIHAEAGAAGMLKTDCLIEAIRSDEYPTRARRPSYSVLSKAKIGEVFGIWPPQWRDGLHRYFTEE